jgi:hypothetical protein
VQALRTAILTTVLPERASIHVEVLDVILSKRMCTGVHHCAGLDFEPIFEKMKEYIVRLLLHVEPDLRQQAEYYPYGPTSFFSMYRFDFLIDPALHPWLIEVNQSPNLSSESTLDLKNMFQRISFSLLHLMGFGYGQLRHPGNTGDHLDIIAHHNDLDIGWRICSNCSDNCDGDCVICRKCRTPEQSRMLRVRESS